MLVVDVVVDEGGARLALLPVGLVVSDQT